MSKGITISKEYGLNTSVLQCPICGKEFGIAMFGSGLRDKKTRKEVEAPHKIAMPGQYCDDCKKILNQGGVFFIECKDEDANNRVENPYRTGRITALKKEAAERIFGQANPVTYVGETVFEHMFGAFMREQGSEAL